MKQFIIQGANIQDMSSFYQEINRVFMQAEDWQIGPSLDALNDLLSGGVGAIKGKEPVHILWMDAGQSARVLGYHLTRDYYKAKLFPGSPFNQTLFEEKLYELEQGRGKTYFQLVQEIIQSHSNIILENH